MIPRVNAWSAMLFGLVAIVSAHGPPAQAHSCASKSVGIDTSLAYPDTLDSMGLRCGEAGGETFFASDTMLQSITVWRHHAQTPYDGSLKLWVTGVDSAGKPNIDDIVLDGPVMQFPFGDGIHPIPMQWRFDPPIALPGKGEYYFAVQDYCGGHWSLLVNLDNAFPDGSAWRNGITCLSDCHFRHFPDQFATTDLIFSVEFCRDTSTPARRESWGKLKMLYR